MQGTADVHHHIPYSRFPHPHGLFAHAAAFDTTVDMFDAHASPSERPIPCFLRPRHLPPAGLLRRLEDGHAVQGARVTPQILPQLTPDRQGIRRAISHTLVRHTTGMRLTQEQNAQDGIDQEEVFERVPFFLAAITRFLCSCVLGARDGSLGTVLTQRGAR
jgi:hypothetical protein